MAQKITDHAASWHDARYLAHLDYLRDDTESAAYRAERRAYWADELPRGELAPNVRVIRDNNSLYMGYVILHRAFDEADGPIAAYEMRLTPKFQNDTVRTGVLSVLGIKPQLELPLTDLTEARVLEPV